MKTNMTAAFLIGAALLVPASRAEGVQAGDITAAVRAEDQTVTVTASLETADKAASVLVNGKWKGERYLSKGSTGPLDLDFAFPDAFCADADIVVTGLVFTVGGNGSNLWGDYAQRMPKAFVLSGSNDGGSTWTEIVSVSAFSDYVATTDATELHTYSGSLAFANWKSYRRYRLYITEAVGSSNYFIQLSEVAFLGLYGGTVTPPEPEWIDLTAAARAANAQTIESNAGVAGTSYALSQAVDGLYGYNNNRYLSNQTTTKNLWDAGDAIAVDYTFGEAFRRGADVIVTGYTIDVDKAFAGSWARLPKTWELQGWDGSAWHTLDRMIGFTGWETVQRANEADNVEHPHYSFTFSITNSVSYRKYRLSVSSVQDRANSSDYFQLTEWQLWGYADAGLAGTVGTNGTPCAFHITTDGAHGVFQPEITVSTYDLTDGVHSGTITNLFDGDYQSAFLARMGEDGDERKFAPLTIGYAIPETHLAGKEIVLKSYSFYSRADGLSQYAQRVPKTWSLRGLAADGTWKTIDRRTNFTGWQTDDASRYYATFDLSANKYAYRSYRFAVSEVAGTSAFQARSDMQQVLLYEIVLDGQWGMGISDPVPRPRGVVVIFR